MQQKVKHEQPKAKEGGIVKAKTRGFHTQLDEGPETP